MRKIEEIAQNKEREAKEGLSEEEKEDLETGKILGGLRSVFEKTDPDFDGDFYYPRSYEDVLKIESLVSALAGRAYNHLLSGKPEEAILIAIKVLEMAGLESMKKLGPKSPNHIVAVAEALNWAAKMIDYTIYSLKPIVIAAASEIQGIEFGLGDDGIYYLGTPSVGCVSLHDPEDEVYCILRDLGKTAPPWKHDWTGIRRQHDAFYIAHDLAEGDGGLTEAYATLTNPEDIEQARKKYMIKQTKKSEAIIKRILDNNHQSV